MADKTSGLGHPMNDHEKVLRELLDTGDVSDWRAMEDALRAAIAAITKLAEPVGERGTCVELPPQKQAEYYADDVYGPADLAAVWNACREAVKRKMGKPVAWRFISPDGEFAEDWFNGEAPPLSRHPLGWAVQQAYAAIPTPPTQGAQPTFDAAASFNMRAESEGSETALPFGNWPESMIDAAEKYLLDHGGAPYRLGGSFNWHEFLDAIFRARPAAATTPRPDAAPPHPLNICPKCKDYYMECKCPPDAAKSLSFDPASIGPFTAAALMQDTDAAELRNTYASEFKDVDAAAPNSSTFVESVEWPWEKANAAVGAQGEEVRAATPEEEAAIDAAAGLAQVTFRLPTEMLGELDHRAHQEGLVRNAKIRFILADYLSAAPAAGKGVDDAMESLDELAEHVGRLNPECCNASFPVAAAKRCIAAIRAALTRQPVAGDGMVLVPREPTEAMIEAAERREDDEPLSVWGKLRPAPHAEIYKAMLAAAPTDTPADGGERKNA